MPDSFFFLFFLSECHIAIKTPHVGSLAAFLSLVERSLVGGLFVQIKAYKVRKGKNVLEKYIQEWNGTARAVFARVGNPCSLFH